MKSLTRHWREYQKEYLSTTKISNHPYEKNIAAAIKLALCFWAFIKSYESNETRRVFLESFTDNSNKYIALIAKIELLPVKIWRKILWRYNIDFLSLESFLRRISGNQIAAIEVNLSDIENGVTPRVLKLTVRDRTLLFLQKPLNLLIRFLEKTFNTKADEKKHDSKRYLSKGAWAYNLGLLDFGFAMYPGGVDSDRRIENRSASRFLSTKNHVNDFIVNQDDGIYWFFYRFVRSYFGFKGYNTVSLSSWICPGFWKTLILSAWFFIGPFISISLLSTILSWKTAILPIVLALPVIGWIVFGVVVTLVIFIYRFAPIVKPIFIGVIFIVIAIIVCAIGAVIVIGIDALTKLLYEIFETSFTAFDPTVLTFIAVFLLLYNISLAIQAIIFRESEIAEETTYRDCKDVEDISAKMIQQKWLCKTTILNVVLILSGVAVYFHSPISAWLIAVWEGICAMGMWLKNNAIFILLYSIWLLFTYYIIL